jgi:hypothetical protein
MQYELEQFGQFIIVFDIFFEASTFRKLFRNLQTNIKKSEISWATIWRLNFFILCHLFVSTVVFNQKSSEKNRQKCGTRLIQIPDFNNQSAKYFVPMLTLF